MLLGSVSYRKVVQAIKDTRLFEKDLGWNTGHYLFFEVSKSAFSIPYFHKVLKSKHQMNWYTYNHDMFFQLANIGWLYPKHFGHAYTYFCGYTHNCGICMCRYGSSGIFPLFGYLNNLHGHSFLMTLQFINKETKIQLGLRLQTLGYG